MQHTADKMRAALTRTGHAPFVVQAAEDTRERADQLAAERDTIEPSFAAEFPLVAAALAEQDGRDLPAGTCPVYRDCTATEPGHFDHHGHDLKVLDDTDDSTILDAGLVALSGDDQHAIVYLRNSEFTDAAAVWAKTAEIRRFLDQVDKLADRAFTDHQARG